MTSAFSCTYVDYRMAPKLALSRNFNTAAVRPGSSNRNIVSLMTCQRTETYSFGNTASNDSLADIFGNLLPVSQSIEGTKPVLKRLATISSGADSWFLGERYITDQVANAFRPDRCSPQLSWLAHSAQEIGTLARQESGLISVGDYPDVAISLLSQNLQSASEDILVFGGGMLGQSVAQHAARSLPCNVHLVTRTPKKLKREVTGDFSICKLYHVAQEVHKKPFSVVIATLGVSNDYADQIGNLIRRPNCSQVIDLSSLPLFSPDVHPSYTHMYDANFSQQVLALNNMIASRLVDANQVIDREIEKYLARMPKLENLS